MTAPQQVLELVKRFERNLDAYKRADYKEARVRVEFIDPFFEALGWDVRNTQGSGELDKDVVHEDAIRVGGKSRAPDYSFRVGRARKFFLEAKKPAVSIEGDVGPAYQLRRYSWSVKLPLGILTDFEEFAVYECRQRPRPSDKASVGRVMYFTYDQYPDHFDEIYQTFSKEAVLAGSFDRYAQTVKKKRGTSEVDAELLKEIEGWRDTLARNIALRNQALSVHELNFAVQRTIDRIIFLRMSEDRGIEEYGRLLALTNGAHIYARLGDLYRQADAKYNAGLFDFETDKLTRTLNIDDKVLKPILTGLYYPQCPYEFSVLPVEILGQVYEQFLGKVIRLTAGHRAKVEAKPEVKKAGGVYYTPSYIVDYIVEQTVGRLVQGQTPRQINKLRVLDPACGSGSFLLGAYQYLLDYHRQWYEEHDPAKYARRKQPVVYQGASGEWRLTSTEKKRILLNNIYGVDIDRQAVEVSKLSLLLQVLQGETEETLGQQLSLWRERALPDLGNNIKCGNSLIGTDYYDGQQLAMFDEEEMRQVNVFDWDTEFSEVMEEGGFSTVIGNPPYDVIEKERGRSSWPHSALREYIKVRSDYQPALGGKLNLFRFFLVQSLSLVRVTGRFGMIVPLALLADISCSKTRRHLIMSMSKLLADCFPQKDNPNRRVFTGAKLSTVVITGKKADQISEDLAKIQVRVYPWNSFNDPYRESIIHLRDTSLIDPKNTPIPLVDSQGWEFCRKVHLTSQIVRLGDIDDFSVRRGEINQTVYRQFIIDDSTKARLLKGVEVGRFHVRDKLSQGYREWFNEKSFLQTKKARPIVYQQRIATQRITGVDERLRIVATLIAPHTYFADSTNSISLGVSSLYRLEYILGLLNSPLFQWRFKLTSTNNNVGTNELKSMPFRTINFTDPADVARHDKMVGLVERMLALHKKLAAASIPADKELYARQIEATDRQIDGLVYELYQLTEKEIAIVEDS